MKIIKNLTIIISVLFLLWFGISYIEILMKNLDYDNPTILSFWNLFNICAK